MNKNKYKRTKLLNSKLKKVDIVGIIIKNLSEHKEKILSKKIHNI